MRDVPQRFEHIRRSARWARILAILGIGGLIVVAVNHLATGYAAIEWLERHWVPVGILAAASLLAALFIFLWSLLNLFLKVEGNSFRSYGVLRDLETALAKQEEPLRLIAENVQISDTVRSVTHRNRERTALRLAINEEIIRGDWEAAYALVEILESRHGYKNEAARLRSEVDRSRILDTQDKVHEAVERIKALIASRDWDRARREMDRLVAVNPEHDEVRELPKVFAQARDEHKRRLLKEWDEAVQRNEVDRGIAILKDLNQFLTPSEAEALGESARGVFREKLRQLAVQFSLAVTGQDWREAFDVGQDIMHQFPNSRMAQEVRDRVHVLAKRAEDADRSKEMVKAG